jgi:hypothetical protein
MKGQLSDWAELIEKMGATFGAFDCSMCKVLATSVLEASPATWESHIFSASSELSRSLSDALAAEDRLPLSDEIPPDPAVFPWRQGDAELPQDFQNKYMFASIVGRGCPASSSDIFAGFYLQSPNSYYPPHRHSADEIYIVLSGTADWSKGDDDLTSKPPGSVIHHSSFEPHTIRTSEAPLLALWGWWGDLRLETYELV